MLRVVFGVEGIEVAGWQTDLMDLDTWEMGLVRFSLIMEWFHEYMGVRLLFVLGDGEFSDDYRTFFRKCLHALLASAMEKKMSIGEVCDVSPKGV